MAEAYTRNFVEVEGEEGFKDRGDGWKVDRVDQLITWMKTTMSRMSLKVISMFQQKNLLKIKCKG